MNYDAMNKMCAWERQKAVYLLNVAENDLKMDTSGYGEIGVNRNSGNTYLWLEDYNFCLYMSINCELKRSNVWVLWTNHDNGDKEEVSLSDMTLQDIYEWVRECEDEYQKINDGSEE